MPKSVLDIDVDDAAFKQFHELFKKYNEALKKTPGEWNKANEGMGEAVVSSREVAAAILAQKEWMGHAVKSAEHLVAAAHRAHQPFNVLSKTVHKIAERIKEATSGFLKWSTIATAVSGLLGIGGLYGFDELADYARTTRRQSQAIGVQSGEREAFDIDYRKYFDPQTVLENIANAKNDPTQRWAFTAMGVNDYNKKDPVQLGVEMALKAKKIFEEGGENQQYAKSRGLLEFYTMDDLRRLHDMSVKEIEASKKKYTSDAKELHITDEVQRKWQALGMQLDTSGETIENVFITHLAPLAGSLGHLSNAVTEAVTTLLSTKNLNILINDLANGITWLSNYLESPKFKTDFNDAVGEVENFAKAVGQAAIWFADLVNGKVVTKDGKSVFSGNPVNKNGVPALPQSWLHGQKPGYYGLDATLSRLALSIARAPKGKVVDGLDPATGLPVARPVNNPGNLRVPGSSLSFQQFPTEKAGVEAMAHQLKLYQDRDHLDTIKQIVSKYAPSSENDTGKYIRYVAAWTGYKDNQKLNLNDPMVMSKLISAMSRQEGHPVSPQQVRIDIMNNTGGSAVVTANSAASQR